MIRKLLSFLLILIILGLEASHFTTEIVEAQGNTVNIANGDVTALRNAISSNNGNQPVTINLANNGSYNFSNVAVNVSGIDHALPAVLNTAGMVINGNGSTLYISGGLTMRFLVTANEQAKLTLNNMTLQNGKLTEFNHLGGAISNYATLNLNNVNFLYNQAYACGAIHNHTTATLNISGGRYANNLATREGGALCSFGYVTVTGTRTNTGDPLTDVFNTVFENNRAPAGGAVLGYIQNTVMTRVKFVNNYAYNVVNIGGSGLGGAIALDGGTYTFSEILIANNIAEHNAGGFHITNGSATISDSWFYNNVAGRNGSGVVTASDGSGGGMFNDVATTHVYRTTFYNNRALEFGGGIANAGTLVLEDVFLDASQARAGAALGNLIGTNIGNITMRAGSQNRSVIRNSDIINGSTGVWASVMTFGPLNISGTAIINNDSSPTWWGVMVQSNASGTISLQNNCIVNTGGVTNYRSGSINAINNWWGSASGPTNLGSGTGDPINFSGSVNASPFATSPVASCYPWLYSSSPPATPTGASTLGNLSSAPATPTYRWNESAGASGYYIYIGTSSGQVHANYYSSSVCNGVVCQITPNVPLNAGDYFWKITAINSFGNSPYTSNINFTVGTNLPTAPTGLTTLNIGSAPTTPTYRWNAVSGATGYYMYVGNGSGQVHAQYYSSGSICSGGTCQVAPSVPLGAGSYFWKVTAGNTSGYGPYSPNTHFTVNASSVPAAPTGLTTLNVGAAPTTPTYGWNAVSGATGYYIYVGNSSGPMHAQYYSSGSICSAGTCQITPTVSLGAGSYFWKVTAGNASGYGPYSPNTHFTVNASSVPTAPTGPTTLNVGIAPTTPTYRWNAVSGATGYYIYLGNSGGQVHAQYSTSGSICSGGTCQVTPSVPLGAGSYFWKVTAGNASGYGPYSPNTHFTVNASSVPAAPTGPTTLNVGSVPATPTYRWNSVSGATGYYIYVGNSSGPMHAQYYSSGSICSGGTCQVTPSVPLGAGSYFWKVTAGNTSGYGPYSPNINFTVGSSVPTAPSGLTTLNVGSVPATPTYRWNSVSGATGYYIYVGNSSGPMHAQYYSSASICSGGTCQVTPSVSLGAGNYFWKVTAGNAAGYGPYSPNLNFTVGGTGLSLPPTTVPAPTATMPAPTDVPTLEPTAIPTEVPTETTVPTEVPTETLEPTVIPTEVPTETVEP